MKALFTLVAAAVMASSALAQTHTEKINKELTFEKRDPAANNLMIANINGSIKVEGYTGDKVMIEVTKFISGKTTERLEKGKADLQLGIIDLADTLILYVQNSCNTFTKDKHNGRHGGSRQWGYCWSNEGRGCHEEYSYRMDFVVKVPANVNISVSTINEGNISVAQVKGAVYANNINGSISLTDLVREANVSTINGDVDIDYTRNPSADCRFYTLNGDINALFQKGLAASMSFESFNGSFYTNVDKLEPMPVSVEKNATDKGMKYKVNTNRFKIGSGGALLDFETFNGDVYVKEKTN